ncbi:hypothetical protein PCANC_10916 [Puccinia coronata f. sp. avenae]|uniref:Uncharacterized protein n=1 Tax=Puccinia coronata f. sp. avenae TaxID=200324 RepID=A0A2N5SZV4_9BASI|nr:hypothetical protein PCANC_10916 [Puccinia coronata f. sp. avenae]
MWARVQGIKLDGSTEKELWQCGGRVVAGVVIRVETNAGGRQGTEHETAARRRRETGSVSSGYRDDKTKKAVLRERQQEVGGGKEQDRKGVGANGRKGDGAASSTRLAREGKDGLGALSSEQSEGGRVGWREGKEAAADTERGNGAGVSRLGAINHQPRRTSAGSGNLGGALGLEGEAGWSQEGIYLR